MVAAASILRRHSNYLFARFLAFLVTGVFFAFLVAFFGVDFFFAGAAALVDVFVGDFFFAAAFAPFSDFGRETPLNLDRTAYTTEPIGFSPLANDSPTIAPAIPVTVAMTGPPTNPPITAPAMPPATGLETRGRFVSFFLFLSIIFLSAKSQD
jgi:hypothetical protein